MREESLARTHMYIHTHIHTRTHTRIYVEGGDNRDANDGSSNNVMHFRSVFKLYKILSSTYGDSFVKGNLLCRLSMLHFLFERRELQCSVPRIIPPSQST